MKPSLFASIVATLLFVGCDHQESTPSASPAQDANAPRAITFETPINNKFDAINVVLADIQHNGGDPLQTECTATKEGDFWHILAWHIVYPNNVGSNRFVPGGQTFYTVSIDGKILDVQGGK